MIIEEITQMANTFIWLTELAHLLLQLPNII